MRRLSVSGLVFTIICIGASTVVAQETQSVSSSPLYQSMLTELARKAPRPTIISAAGKLIETPMTPPHVEASESATGLRLETAAWRLEVAKSPFEVTLTNKLNQGHWTMGGSATGDRGISWAVKGTDFSLHLTEVTKIERQDNAWVMQGRVVNAQQPVTLTLAVVAPGIVRLTVDGSSLAEEAASEFHVAAAGAFFGLGEQFGRARLNDLKLPLRPDDLFSEPEHKWDYMSIPFLFSPEGLGAYFDTSFNCIFDSTTAQGPGFTMQIGGPTIDLYLMVASSPKGIIEAYTSLTGRPPLSPPWAFGVWHNALQGRDAVLAEARRLRQQGIPVSAIWEWDLMDDATNFGWPLWTVGYYGDPREFTTELHKLGFKALGYVHPYVRKIVAPYLMNSPTYDEGLRNHYFVVKPDRQPIGPTFEAIQTGNVDFTNPRAVDWWAAMIRRIVRDFDFDGWMEDFGEWVRDDHQFANGKTGRVMATLNPLFYHKLTYEIARQLKPDVVPFSRSGAPGSQAFTRVLWGGDQTPNWNPYTGYPSVVTAGITAGLAGFAVWGPDILSSSTSKELYIRWCEFGALTPVMRDHLWDKPKFGVDIWFDSETTDVFKKYARLHVSLFPYLYTYAHAATATGVPIMRHLVLEFPADPKTYDAEHEYLLGEKFLVAPVVVEGARARKLYLPEGAWVDYWTGETLSGGREVTVPAPLHHIPMVVRAGSVIPFASPDMETLATDLAGTNYRTLDNSLIWRVFPSPQAIQSSFKLYDGTVVSVAQEARLIRVEGDSATIRQYEIVLPLATAPRRVTVSGRSLQKLDDAAYHSRQEGWWSNPDQKTLHILFLGHKFKLAVETS